MKSQYLPSDQKLTNMQLLLPWTVQARLDDNDTDTDTLNSLKDLNNGCLSVLILRSKFYSLTPAINCNPIEE